MQCALVVEDHPQKLTHMSDVLRGLGAEIWQAHDYEEAISAIEAQRFDIAVVDLMLTPSGDDELGLMVMRALKQRNARTPVIIVTGYGTLERGVQAMQGGAFDFINESLSGVNYFRLLRNKAAIALGCSQAYS